MAEITLELIQQLRDRTGVGMMDCKKALTEAGGDIEKAIELLRKKGLQLLKNVQATLLLKALCMLTSIQVPVLGYSSRLTVKPILWLAPRKWLNLLRIFVCR